MKAGERFHAILQIESLYRHSRSASYRLMWRDHMTGKLYQMWAVDFNRLVKQGEWSGPLLYDGLWESDGVTIKAVLPEDLE